MQPKWVPNPAPLYTAALCPLCGRSNACAMVLQQRTGQAQPPCWCMSAVPSLFTPALLDRVPPAAKGLACICQTCATAACAP